MYVMFEYKHNRITPVVLTLHYRCFFICFFMIFQNLTFGNGEVQRVIDETKMTETNMKYMKHQLRK